MFVVDGVIELVFAVLAAVVVLGFAERLMGTWRVAITFVATSVIGAGIGILAQSIGVADGEMWSRGVREMFTFDPFTPIAGAIMAASCFAGPLWRRRIRVITITVLLTLVLYSGQPSDVYRLIAAGAGIALGLAFRPARVDLTWHRSSDHESRTLLAAVVGVLAVGPLVTLFSGGRFGILAPLGLLLTHNVPDATEVADRCLVGNVTRQCVQELTLERVDGIGPLLVSLLPLTLLLIASFGLARGRRFAAWLAIIVNGGLAVLGGWYYGLLPITGQPFVWHWRSTHYWEIALVLVVSVLVPLVTAGIILVNLRHFPVKAPPRRLRRFVVRPRKGVSKSLCQPSA